MTFIITLVAVEAQGAPLIPGGPLELSLVPNGPDAWASAGYLPGLARYFPQPVYGSAYYVTVDEGNGYRASNSFFRYPNQEDPAVLHIPREHREAFDTYLRRLTEVSPIRRVLIVAEYNGQVTAPDLSDEDAASVQVLGSMTRSEFWKKHDAGLIKEDSISILTEAE